ncbi:MAG: YebC/PmpR family DNA-binding transcriptional regulator [Fusobacteriota bacterium]
MAGHSKWANIKHKKAKEDKKRGKIFSKLSKELTVAVREGGADEEFNPRLRLAIDKAKNANMPKDNIQYAIDKGAGNLDGVEYISMTYEGYGPEGVAILVSALTDNKNRTAASVRSIFTRNNGNLGSNGSVSWMFERKGVINILKENTDEMQLMEVALENGAEDIEEDESGFTVLIPPTDYEDVKNAIDEAGIEYENAEITMLPDNEIKISDVETAKQILDLIDKLEDDEDVQDVYANYDIADEIYEQLD